jgi:hypothetical protein
MLVRLDILISVAHQTLWVQPGMASEFIAVLLGPQRLNALGPLEAHALAAKVVVTQLPFLGQIPPLTKDNWQAELEAAIALYGEFHTVAKLEDMY